MDHSQNLADERKSYERDALKESDAALDPLRQFKTWMDEAFAAKVPEPNAMTLATVGADGRPSTRIVLIKGCDERGIVWFTNYDSRKGRELAVHPFAALQFHWVELERVVRIEGPVERVDDAESDAYFASRAVLAANAAKFAARFLLNPPRPPHWGGFRLKPDTWEFWQGRKSRLHDRLRYRKDDEGGWVIERLSP